MKQDDFRFSWLMYIEEILVPAMGYADLENINGLVSYSAIISNSNWNNRHGIAGGEILDFTGYGSEELLLFYFDQSKSIEDYSKADTELYARLYHIDESGKIYKSQPLILPGRTENEITSGCVGVMIVENICYLYTENLRMRQEFPGCSQEMVWYGSDGDVFYKRWEIKISVTSDEIQIYLMDYLSNEKKELLFWTDGNYFTCKAEKNRLYDAVTDAFKSAFSIIGKPVGEKGLNIDDFLYKYLGIKCPTAFGTDILIPSFRYLNCGINIHDK